MTRTLIAIVAGYLTITVFNALTRIIAWFYFNNDFSLAGIENVPSDFWVYTITALQFILGVLGGLMASSIAKSNDHLAILGFILLMVAVGLIDYSMLNEREPLWYLIASPLLNVSGIYLGYRLKLRQNEQLN